MKQFKQLAALFLAFAMVIGVFSVPTVAYAADETTLTTKVNYETEEIEVTKESGDTIYYTTKYNAKNPASTTWDEAYVESTTATKAAIDFSNVSAKGATYYVTKDTADKPTEVKIQAQETTLAVAFSGTIETTAKSKIKVAGKWGDVSAKMAGYSNSAANPWAYGFLCVAVKGDSKSNVALTPAEVENYLEYKVGATGNWKSITTLNLKKYSAAGAQLYFRIKAKPSNIAPATDSALKLLGRTSKEVKVTYTKQANAPKLTIKGDTKQVALTKTMEYRVGTTSGSTIIYKDWISVADKHMTANKVNTVYLKDLLTASGTAWSYDEAKAGQVIQVRTAATEKAIASKIRTVKLNAVETPIISSSSGISFELVDNTTYDKGIKVTNNATTGAIQVAVVVSGSGFNVNDTKSVKWTTIAANSSKGAKSSIIKGKALEAGDTIIYRYATVKDNTKTAANEFMVSSNFATYDFKANLPLAGKVEKSISVGSTATVTTGSGIAKVTTSGTAIDVVYTSTPGAVTFTVNLEGKNIADSSVKLDVVATATADATADNSAGIIANSEAMKSGKAKLTVDLTADSAEKTRYFRVTADGHTTYIKVTVTKQ